MKSIEQLSRYQSAGIIKSRLKILEEVAEKAHDGEKQFPRPNRESDEDREEEEGYLCKII